MEQSNKTVEPSKQKLSLLEIMQVNETQFALCRYDSQSDQLIQCHQFIKCRDFFNEVFVGLEENRDMEIYGFKWTKENPRPDCQNASLLMKLENEESLANMTKNQSILKDIEEFLGWSTSYYELVSYPGVKKPIVWVCGDKQWQRSSVAFSLYTFLLKCLTYKIKDKDNWMEEIAKIKGKYGEPAPEAEYVKDTEYMNYLLQNMNEVNARFTTYTGWKQQHSLSVYTLHDDSGFVSLRPCIFPKAKESKEHFAQHVLYNYCEREAA